METQRDQPGAVIIGGHYLSLGAARNLAEAGIRVHVVECGPCVAQFSRLVTACHHSPPLEPAEEFVSFLLELAERERLDGWVLFPSTDESVKLLAQQQQRLGQRYRFTTPAWDIVRVFYDKRLTWRLATTQNVPIPWTLNPQNEAEVAGLALEYPVVIKPAITTHLSSVTKKKAYRANDHPQLLATYRMMTQIVDPGEILIQELIPGRAENLYSFFGLFDQGELVAGASARRPRQHPMEFGRASTLAVTVHLPELEHLATRLMQGTGYFGLAEVEFMVDPRQGCFKFLEVNPRIWGWHTIAAQAGVNLPYLTYAQALGLPAPPGDFRQGVRWIRLLTDVPTAASEIWRHNLTLRDYLRSLRGCRDAVFSLQDPLPFFMEFLLIPYYARQRGF